MRVVEGSQSGRRNANCLRRQMSTPTIGLWLTLRRNDAGLRFRNHITGARPLRSRCGRVEPVYNVGMTRSYLSHLHAFSVALAPIVGAVWSSASFAQSTLAPVTQPAPSSPTDTIRLTDEQRMEILDNNTEESAAAARGELAGSGLAGRGVHGEVGVMVGSHGTRGAYGVADIPLGENAGATVSFESSRSGYRR